MAVLGVAVATLPALAATPSKITLQVNENCVEPAWPCWTTETSAAPQPALKVTITEGGEIEFVDEASTAPKVGVNWIGTAPACTGVPTTETSPNWKGKCTFATPGTYHFESSTMFKEPPGLYSKNLDYTKYEVVVDGSATTPSTGTTTGGGTTPGTTTSSTTPTGENPTGSPLSGAPAIHSSQRGSTVKGSLQIAKAGAGDRLEVDLIATTASLAKAGHKTQVVGRFVSASVSAGQQSFSVKLNAKARKALKRHHHLALKVKITLTPVYG
ncbi:MAG: hypothetical protein ACRDK2_14845, partial [Solirubrobacteraceae bacterium]